MLGKVMALFQSHTGYIANNVHIGCNIYGKTLKKRHDLTKPQGVRGRNSDNTRLRAVLDWEPSVSLENGLDTTYHWIEKQLVEQGRLGCVASAYPIERS